MLPFGAGAPGTSVIGYGATGTQYFGLVGGFVDVANADAATLQGQHWVLIAPSGPTANRPPFASISPTPIDGVTPPAYPAASGKLYLDTTLGKLIVADGYVWRDPVTGYPV